MCYVTFFNVPPQKGGAGGRREFFVKVFDMVPRLADDRHDQYKKTLGFSGSSGGIESYSLGICTLHYPGLMDFNAGRIVLRQAGSLFVVGFGTSECVGGIHHEFLTD